MDDLSYAYDQMPDFLTISHWAGIGTPNPFKSGTIPAQERYEDGTLFINSCGDNTMNVQALQNSSISIYPNPVINMLNYNVNKDIERIEVYNLLGQNIKNYGSNDFLDNSIDLSSLTNGVYLLKFYAQSQVYTTKVSKE